MRRLTVLACSLILVACSTTQSGKSASTEVQLVQLIGPAELNYPRGAIEVQFGVRITNQSADAIRRRLSEPLKQSHLRDFIYGGIDGTVTTFAVVAGVAVLLTDKRGSGASTDVSARAPYDTLASDVLAAVEVVPDVGGLQREPGQALEGLLEVEREAGGRLGRRLGQEVVDAGVRPFALERTRQAEQRRQRRERIDGLELVAGEEIRRLRLVGHRAVDHHERGVEVQGVRLREPRRVVARFAEHVVPV